MRRLLELSLASIALLPSPVSAQGDEENPLAASSLRSFDIWWDRYTIGIYDLHGQATSGKDADAERRKVSGMMRDIAARVGGVAAAEVLWKAVIFDVDPQADNGMLFIRSQPWFVRREARAAIASIGAEGPLLPWLDRKLADAGKSERDSPRLAAMDILGLMEDPRVKPLLMPFLRVHNALEQIAAMKALAACCSSDLEVISAIIPLTKTSDPGARITAMNLLSRLAAPYVDETAKKKPDIALPEGMEKVIVEALGSRLRHDKVWQVRQAATQGLLGLRSRLAVPELIAGMRAESEQVRKAKTSQLVHNLQDALYQLTGQDIPASAVDGWERYWQANGSNVVILSAEDMKKRQVKESDERYMKYFSIDVTSDRILFVVDRSGSMLEPAQLKGKYSNLDANAAKFEIVQRELEKLILSLPGDTAVNVVFFSDDVRVWKLGRSGLPTLQTLTDENKSDLIEHIRLTSARGATNVWDALDTAFSAAGRGLTDKYYQASFDTMYILSDGAPTTGPVVDTEEILAHVREVNQLRQVVIHTITFGDVNNALFMEKLSKQNGGRHVHIE